MRTTINIPDRLLSDLETVSGDKPKTAVIREALEQYVKQKRREKLLGLRGSMSLKDVTKKLETAEIKDAERLGRKIRHS